MVGHDGKRLHQVKAGGSAQFLPRHFGQGADVFIAQAAHAEHGFGGFAHAHQPGRAFGTAGEVQRRHFCDAVAVVFIRRAKGYIPAGNMRNGDMPCRSRCSHCKNFKAVAQKQHRIRAVGGKIAVKYRDGACNGKGHRFVGVLFFKNRQAGRNGQAVSLNFLHRIAKPGTEMCPGNNQL